MRTTLVLLAASFALVGCTSIPTEYISPCACLYEPVNKVPSTQEPEVRASV